MLPKNGLLVKKISFFGWIIKVHDKTYNLELKEFYFCNFTIFELTNQIGHFESLCVGSNLFTVNQSIVIHIRQLIFLSEFCRLHIVECH